MEKYRVPSEEEKALVWKHFNTNKKRLEEDVCIVREWLKTQEHLPQNLNDEFLEKNILGCKNSIERTKQKLETYFVTKYMLQNLFHAAAEIIPSKEPAYFLPMPKMTSDMVRVFVWKLKNFNEDEFNAEMLAKTGMMLAEISTHVTYAIGDRFILDVEGLTLGHLANLNPQALLRFINEYLKSYPGRILSIEFINMPSYANIIMGIAKTVLNSKLVGRIKCHANLKALHASIPKELLPKDYEGDMPELKELLGKWDEFIESHRHILRKSIQEYYTVVKSSSPDDDIFSVQGTFRKLNID